MVKFSHEFCDDDIYSMRTFVATEAKRLWLASIIALCKPTKGRNITWSLLSPNFHIFVRRYNPRISSEASYHEAQKKKTESYHSMTDKRYQASTLVVPSKIEFVSLFIRHLFYKSLINYKSLIKGRLICMNKRARMFWGNIICLMSSASIRHAKISTKLHVVSKWVSVR